MLQQTRVSTVLEYYSNFVRRFPTLRALARAPLDEVLRAWEGMGYYARARNLHRAARIAVQKYGGRLPSDPETLKTLPGFGPCITAAVASLAFGKPLPVLDGNVRRVLCRWFAISDAQSEKVQRRAEELIRRKTITPGGAKGPLLRGGRSAGGNPGEWNQALMELGQRVCLPRNPACGACPAYFFCQARRRGNPEAYPRRRPPRVKPFRKVHAAILRDADGRVFLVRRPERGLLGGLWDLPTAASLEGLTQKLKNEGFFVSGWKRGPFVNHEFTHFRMRLLGHEARISDGGNARRKNGARWVFPNRSPVALPRATRRLLEKSS